MRWLQDKVERFCIEHPNFGIPNLMLYIAVLNVGVYLIDGFSNGSFAPLLAFYRDAIFQGQVWRLVTFVALGSSSGGLLFVVLSAYFYYWVGALLEREWGTTRLTVFYAMGILLNILFGLIAGFASMYYVNLSLFFAFAVLFPDLEVRIFFILPVKVKWLAWIDAALFAWSSISALLAGSVISALLPLVAIFNFFLFFWEDFMETIGRRKARFQHQHSAQTINFKKATKTIYEKKGYLRKCAVCGITDTDDPTMEFRYCSKCTGGTYCYCMKHINDHVHIV